jgi:DNA-binding CsgD family transcriptional regulator
MLAKSIICCLFLLAAGLCGAQNTIGIPEFINYSKQQYGAGTQTWDIRQDKKGILYFGNNDGLLTFDGSYWKVYPLPNKTIVRSLWIENEKIYVGGQDEVGYFSPNKSGTLVYTSLNHLIPVRDRSFADVWDIVPFEGALFFRTSNKIFELSNGKVSVTYSTDWRFLDVCTGQLVAQDNKLGLLRYRRGIWEPFLKDATYPKDFLVTGIIPFGTDSCLMTTFRHGTYLITNQKMHAFTTPDLKKIEGDLIYTAATTSDGHAMLATTLGGVYVVNKNGNIVQKFSRTEGLQNNNILTVFFDRDKNLWLGLDNGIDFIAYNSPIRHIYTSGQNEGSGYTSMVRNNTLYIGTSNGLYSVPIYPSEDLSFVRGDFRPVQNTKGQVWNLSEVNGQLLMGHHEGAYTIEGNTARLLEKSTGFWTFQPFTNVVPSSIMVTGTYQGIKLFDYRNNSFSKSSSQADFASARFVTVDNTGKTIWVAHPYKGIYKIDFDEKMNSTVMLYSNRNGLSSINNNYVFKVKNHIVSTTENGVYEYDPEKDMFQPSAFFSSFLNLANIRYLKEDLQGNIWFVRGKSLGVVDMSGEEPKIIYVSELTDKLVNGFEFVYPVDKNNILVGAEKGFYHINYNKYREQKTIPEVYIRTVRASGRSDSLLFGGYTSAKEESEKDPSIANPWNSLHFEFSSTVYGQQGNVEYSYYLEGYDKGWSDWSRKVEKDYSYLPAGDYSFQVKARNNLTRESVVQTFSFTILPPWYQTTWAYALYAILIVSGAWFLYRHQQKKFLEQQKKYEEEQERLRYLHQLEIEKTEKELIKLRNEKLEAEIAHKNTELASSAMHLVQKGELMTKIKEEITRMKKDVDKGKTEEDLKKIIKALNEEDKINEDWQNFAIHFDKVHSDFLNALKNRFPNLTPNELKLSAYLRMNLSTKEVAQLMNISVRGVEISRYRLRKKLQLPTEVNLFDFLMSIHMETAFSA